MYAQEEPERCVIPTFRLSCVHVETEEGPITEPSKLQLQTTDRNMGLYVLIVFVVQFNLQ